jgi:multidrug resistance protein, MATE family
MTRLSCFLTLACLVLLSLSESVRSFAVVGRGASGFQKQRWRAEDPDRALAFGGSTGSTTTLLRVTVSGVSSMEAPMPESDSLLSISVVREDDHSLTASSADDKTPRIWPCFDALDNRLIRIALPVIANYAISPLIGAVDLFWVNRMGNALAVAGQAAANQVFNSIFWLTSFLPAVTATLIAKENKNGNKEGVQDAVCQALFVGVFMAALSSALLLLYPTKILSSVLTDGAPAIVYAKPYLMIRTFAFIPSLISLVGFSAFRGVLDTVTPVKISSFANIFNAALDPILIFTFAMGVPGAALATLCAEVISAITYLYLLRKRDMIRFSKLIRPPSWKKLEPLLRGGAALQMRNVALNLTFLAVARVTQAIDQTGVAAAAHALSIQTFQLGGVVLLALSTVAQTVVPSDMQYGYDEKLQRRVGGKLFAKATVNRLMSWGFILGSVLGALQIALLPLIAQSTPLAEVRNAARVPAMLASLYQIINGMVFIGEGVMVGTGSFFQLSLSTVVATVGCLWALNTLPSRFGLTGVWMCFGIFNSLRLVGVLIHLFNGPLARKNIKAEIPAP